MKKYTIYILLTALFLSSALPMQAQNRVRGKVTDAETREPLAGATVRISGTTAATAADASGEFSLGIPKDSEGWIVASYLGYAPDSVALSAAGRQVEFALSPAVTETGEVVVVAYQNGTVFSGQTLQKTETISSAGLMKMACCNLSESFENSAAVTVGYTDAVSGAKQVQLLGLSGIYSQMMAENIPTMRGLASTYGWSYSPGTWLESIQVSKGASSVTNGYESITGQINLEFRKPETSEPLFINLYGDESLRFEANVAAAIPVTKHLWTGLMLHGSIENKEHDYNRDGFMDTPRTQLYNIYNRWSYQNPEKMVESRTGIKYIWEDRKGGQLSSIGNDRYKTAIGNRNLTVYNKTGIGFRQKEGQSLGLITSFTHHEQDSAFGMKDFAGTQNSFYFNSLFSSWIGSPDHGYITGVSFNYDNYRTHYRDDRNEPGKLYPLNREEIVPGVYAQYTYNYDHKLTLMLGARGDWNSAYGMLFTPRANVRYEPWEFMVLRASAGRGFRSPNVIAENIGLMASSRTFDVGSIDGLGIESAWNFGGNVAFYIPIWSHRKATLSLDWFHTAFDNQVIVDTERNTSDVYFYNLDGRSFADAWQADLTFTVVKGLDIYGAFRYNDTEVTLTDGAQRHTVEKPLTSRYRGLINVSYATNFKKWVFDYTAQANGPSRLPSLAGYGAAAEYSPTFWIHFFQVTKNSKRFDIYAGVENIFNFRQPNPIIDWQDPFAADFDSSRIWGPLMGRRIYAGIRLRIGKL